MARSRTQAEAQLNERVRVLHLRASNFVGGPERQLLRYGDYEREGPLELIFGTFIGENEGRDFAKAIRRRGLHLVALPAGRLGDVRAVPALVRYLNDNSIALICTHGYQADLLGTIAGRHVGIPVAWFLRGWTGENWKVRVYETLDRALLRLAARVVCLSHAQAKEFGARRAVAPKIRIVHNAVESRPVSTQERQEARRKLRLRMVLPADSPVVAIAGRLSPEKGAAHFLQAVPSIAGCVPESRFAVFGSGALETPLKEMARALGIGPITRFMGFLPGFPQLLPGIDVMVSPSLSEVVPNAVLESMAAGVPVVATDVGSVAEIAGPNRAIELIPARDSAAMARAVTDLLRDPERAAGQRRAAEIRLREAFSPELQKLQLRQLYRECVPQLAKLADPNRSDASADEALGMGSESREAQCRQPAQAGR